MTDEDKSLPHKPERKKYKGEKCIKCGTDGLTCGRWYAHSMLCDECYERYNVWLGEQEQVVVKVVASSHVKTLEEYSRTRI